MCKTNLFNFIGLEFMNKQILFSTLLYLIFSAAIVAAEPPQPETLITLSASLGEDHGQVKVPYKILKYSEYITTMAGSGFSESEYLENKNEINLDYVFGVVVGNLRWLGIEFSLSSQEWLNKIVRFLVRIDQPQEELICGFLEDLFLNDTDFDQTDILISLFTGDVLDIQELVDQACSVLAKNISRVNPEILFGLMQFDEARFSAVLAREIVKQYHGLFYPIDIEGRVGIDLDGHSLCILSMSFSPDGKQILTSSKDKTAKIWEEDGGGIWKCIAILEGHDSWVFDAQFSSDGKYIVTASWDKTAKIWGLDEDGIWGCLTTLVGHNNKVKSSCFSFDDRYIVTASQDNTAKVWERVDGDRWEIKQSLDVKVDPQNCAWVYSAKFSQDGKRIVTASGNNAAYIWELDVLENWNCVAKLEGHSDGVISAAFSPDGNSVVTASYDKDVRVWDWNLHGGWRCVARFECFADWDNLAEFSPDGKRIVVARFKTTRVLEKNEDGDWRCVAKLDEHRNGVMSKMFSCDGTKIFAVSGDGIVMVWDISSLNQSLLFNHIMFFVLAAEHPIFFQDLKKEKVRVFKEVWHSFHPSIQRHLKNKFEQINFDQFKNYGVSRCKSRSCFPCCVL